jgi:glycosyltransferase involved in cell wall biosynthesis
MTDVPGVSVVIATRDRPEMLRAALAAVLDQGYEGEVEVVVVFDRTEPDRTLERTSPGRRVRVLVNERAPGLPGARNTGIVSSHGEIVAFCDDDDEWLPGKLAAQVRHLAEHPGSAFCTTGIQISFDGAIVDRPSPVGVLTVEHLVHDRQTEAHPSGFVFRRSLVEEIGLVDEAIPGGYSEDYDFLLRAARATTVTCLREPLVRVRWGRTSYFATRWRTIVDAQRYLVAHHPEFLQHRRAEARINGQIAFALAALGERREALGTVVRGVVRWPFEKRWPVALAVTTGLVSADRALEVAHRSGRGI